MSTLIVAQSVLRHVQHAYVVDTIFDDLKRHNVDVDDKDDLSYYIQTCHDEHRRLFVSLYYLVDGMSFRHFHEEMNVNNFGRIVPYLALVYAISAC